jgi:hypothetical protein
MTTKKNKTSPTKPAKVNEALVHTNTTSEGKSVPKWDIVEIRLETLKDGSVQGYLIGDGVPYPFWTHAYKNLEMTAAHAGKVKERLTETKHFISIPKDEMLKIYPIINDALTIKFKPHEYVFLTEEGQERVLLEVNTSGMKNKDVAARINQRKDEMVSIFVKFRRGELVSTMSVDMAEFNKKDTSTLRGIRNDIIKTLAHKKHPSNPNTVRRIIGSYHNDFAVIHGDNVPFVPGWLKDASDKDAEITVAHTAFDISALAAGKLEISERREFEDVLFKQFCLPLRPAHLTDSIDTTKQTQLLVEG